MQSEAGTHPKAATSVVPGGTARVIGKTRLGSQGRAARRTAQPQLTRARCEPVKLKQPLLLEDEGGSGNELALRCIRHVNHQQLHTTAARSRLRAL